MTLARELAPATRPEPEVPGSDIAPPDVSLVIPVAERPESLVALYEEYAAVMQRLGRSYEFLFVAHPYFGELLAPLRALAARGAPVRVIEVGRSIGETALLRIALGEARGAIVATAPPYRQTEADALGEVVGQVEAGADFAVARRWPRRDPLLNRLQHAVLHRMIGRLGGDRVHDIGCGVRAMRRDAARAIPLYGDFGRFLPLLALHQGYAVTEVEVPQHVSDTRRRVYGPGVYLRRLIDVFGLFFLMRFTDKPLRFFGLVGSGLGLAGTLVLAVLFVQRLGGQGVADRPLLVLGVLLVTVGVQAIALGLVGEMIVHFSASRSQRYRLKGAPGDPGAGPHDAGTRG